MNKYLLKITVKNRTKLFFDSVFIESDLHKFIIICERPDINKDITAINFITQILELFVDYGYMENHKPTIILYQGQRRKTLARVIPTIISGKITDVSWQSAGQELHSQLGMDQYSYASDQNNLRPDFLGPFHNENGNY